MIRSVRLIDKQRSEVNGMNYNVIDADGHVTEPPNLWEEYMDPKFREGCPKLVTTADGREILRVEYDDAVDLGRGKARINSPRLAAFAAPEDKVPPNGP